MFDLLKSRCAAGCNRSIWNPHEPRSRADPRIEMIKSEVEEWSAKVLGSHVPRDSHPVRAKIIVPSETNHIFDLHV